MNKIKMCQAACFKLMEFIISEDFYEAKIFTFLILETLLPMY